MATNPGSLNDTLQDLHDTIVFSAYIVQRSGQIVTCDNEIVTYGRVLL
jgi:hypothetical protein